MIVVRFLDFKYHAKGATTDRRKDLEILQVQRNEGGAFTTKGGRTNSNRWILDHLKFIDVFELKLKFSADF